jgi:glutaredoxin 3
MRTATVYARDFCGYCTRAISLLRHKGVPLNVIDTTMDAAKHAEMVTRSGRRTVPQVFIGETHVGGCDDLYALEAAGRLDALLEDPA